MRHRRAPEIRTHPYRARPVLTGRSCTGLLTVCAQILQAQDRIDFYAELADPVRGCLTQL
ncbi:hypothetical protein ACIF8W_17740 [Streptomyces sp. NPDC085639]|uniref:hypothetical protein n=1 Tax=Streptomyces sp. NPDC085639 TaxID=3365734 RepID=UPI0037D1588C